MAVKKIKVMTLQKFKDLNENRIRTKGEVFEVTKSRFDKIMAVQDNLIEEYKEESPEGKETKEK
ncbi:MAG: hypothetical protein ACOX1S_05325 [Anaerostipes sp.]|jgi:hypothetical protein|nr:hypothetical protein [Anaerostipes sp.]